MSDIDEMKLRRLDITLLLVFLNLMRERRAVTVADRMGLTQSSISHALKRLRAVFDDPLFLRKPHGLEPTAVAIAVEPAIREALDRLNGMLQRPGTFRPEEATGTIRLAAYDSEMALLVPGLIGRLATEAPGLRLAGRMLGRAEALAALDDGSADIAAGFIWDLPQAFLRLPLYEEGYLVAARHDHPLLAGPLDIDTYAAARHLVVSPAGDLRGIVDDRLSAAGRSRSVVCAVPQFFPALAALACSDLVATLPAGLVRLHAAAFGLAFREPPLALRRFEVAAFIHRRNERNPMIEWLAGVMREVAQAVQAHEGPFTKPVKTGTASID